MNRLHSLVVTVLVAITIAVVTLAAQNVSQGNQTVVQNGLPLYYLTPISATAAVNNQVTLTIPAPAAGLFNYVCNVQFRISQDGTATAVNNGVTTSTNFNSFAFAMSAEDVAQKESIATMTFGTPSTGCAKSTLAGTATTFVGPAAITNGGQWWGAAYYVAP